MFNNAINAWWPLLFYPANDAPSFRKGMITMICTCAATLCVTALVWYLERQETRGVLKGYGQGSMLDEKKDTDEEKRRTETSEGMVEGT